MSSSQCDVGMVGLGVMGSNLVLNIAEHGFSIVGYDKDPLKANALASRAKGLPVYAAASLTDFVAALKKPAMVILLVPAGFPVDETINDLLPHLSKEAIIIDGGNSHFQDTDARAALLAEKNIHFLGVGISGGEEGARHGPCLMPGGPKPAYERCRPILEAIAARAGGFPCVAYMGPGSAGHYVKMVHNGIEYGLMQLIAETYDLMKRSMAFDDRRLSEVYDMWNQGELRSFLVEISVEIFRKIDEKTGKYLIDVILDEAKQKGTGMWTSENAMQLQVPVPTIDAAVSMRDLSTFKILRQQEAQLLKGPDPAFSGKKDELLTHLGSALYAAMLLTYVQGFALLCHASRSCNYGFNLSEIARVWRNGCIIRSAIVEKIFDVLTKQQNCEHLLDEPKIAEMVVKRQESLRRIVKVCAELGIPAPAMMASLSYFDSFRSAWLPANLIQAQRDRFGSHTYERIDAKGTFHTLWQQEKGAKP